MVKLYEPRLCEGDINMVEMGNGDWVSYEDYAALELKVVAALSHLERATEAENRVLCSGYAKMALSMLKDA